MGLPTVSGRSSTVAGVGAWRPVADSPSDEPPVDGATRSSWSVTFRISDPERRDVDGFIFRRWGVTVTMELVLWQALAGTRGGPNRVRILRAVDRRPRNANQLADDLELAYNTVRHHLEVLERNGILTSSEADYGRVYLPSDRVRNHWEVVEEIVDRIEE
jgi:DNA-binding transcriptional ArsR family regulator